MRANELQNHDPPALCTCRKNTWVFRRRAPHNCSCFHFLISASHLSDGASPIASGPLSPSSFSKQLTRHESQSRIRSCSSAITSVAPNCSRFTQSNSGSFCRRSKNKMTVSRAGTMPLFIFKIRIPHPFHHRCSSASHRRNCHYTCLIALHCMLFNRLQEKRMRGREKNHNGLSARSLTTTDALQPPMRLLRLNSSTVASAAAACVFVKCDASLQRVLPDSTTHRMARQLHGDRSTRFTLRMPPPFLDALFTVRKGTRGG